MRIFKAASTVFLLLLMAALALPTCAAAADQVTLYCHSAPQNLRLIKLALKHQVTNSISTEEFSNIRVSVRTRRLAVQPAAYNHAIADLLQDHGLAVARQDQEGLEFNVAGTWEITETDQCIFGYNVYITVTARRVSSGERLRYTTTSRIDINETVNGRIHLQ